MLVKIEDVSFRYRKKFPLVLNGVTYCAEGNGITVLLGLNGCGKTTLIKLLAGLEKPSQGQVYYDDDNLNDISIRKRSKVFSYVPQHLSSAGDIPVRQYLLYGTTNTLSAIERPGIEEEKAVEKMAERLSVTHLLDKNLDEISGGELQIVLIACAMIQNTPVVLLDEPTSALDLKNQYHVLSILKEIASKENKRIVLSTHNPNHASFLKSDVALIQDGKIVKSGNADEIITVEQLKEIYGDHVCYSDELGYKEISFK